jgi:hypothetical protein
MRDALYNLLHDADRSAPAAPAHAVRELTKRVYRRRQRRRIGRGAAIAATLVLMAISPLIVQHLRPQQLARHDRPHDDAGAPRDRRTGSAQAELASLDTAIARHAQTADLLVAVEKRRATRDKNILLLAREDRTITQVQQQREQAARTLLGEAERLNAHSPGSSEAAQMYRRAIELFPDTSAATVAQRRLQQL